MSTTYETDSKLIQAITRMKEGDESGFAYLYEATYKYVSARAKAMLDDEQERQDLIQEVYLSIYRSIKNLEEPEKIYGWIKTLIFNQYTKLIKKGQKEVLVSEEAENVLEEIPDYESQTEDDYVNKEDIEIIRSCIERLPEEQRTVVMAYYFDNLKVNEISDLFSVSDGTVKSRLFAARKKLKQNIEEEEKKLGYKLHSFGGFTLILAIRAYLQQNMEATHMANDSLFTQIYNELKQTAQSTEEIVKTATENAISEVVTEGTANTANMMAKAVGLGGKELLWSIVGVVAAAIVSASVIAMVLSNKPEEPENVLETETEDITSETITETQTKETESVETEDTETTEEIVLTGDALVADIIARNTAYRADLALFYNDGENENITFNVKDYDGDGIIEMSMCLGGERPELTHSFYSWINGKSEDMYMATDEYSMFYCSETDTYMYMLWWGVELEEAYPGMKFQSLHVVNYHMKGKEGSKDLYAFYYKNDGTYEEYVRDEDYQFVEKISRTEEEVKMMIEECMPNYVLIENTIPYSPENLDKYLPIDEEVIRKQLEESSQL